MDFVLYLVRSSFIIFKFHLNFITNYFIKINTIGFEALEILLLNLICYFERKFYLDFAFLETISFINHYYL